MQPRPLNEPTVSPDAPGVQEAMSYLHDRDMFPELLRFRNAGLLKCFAWVEEEVAMHMEQWEAKMAVQSISRLIQRVYEWYIAWEHAPAFMKHARGEYIALFRARWLACLPPSFTLGLRLFLRTTLPTLPANERLFHILEQLGISERFDKTFIDVMFDEVEQKILDTCPGMWREPRLDSIRKSAKDLEERWLTMVYGHMFVRTQNSENAMMMVTGRLDHFISRNLVELRTSEIFDIIVDFPDTLPAVQDLRLCMARSLYRPDFIEGLREVVNQRILQPAADTDDIITFYVSLIRCLRIIDPQGVILHKVAPPIRKYLRDRPDAVRCIVKRMTDENESFMQEGEQVVPIQQVHEPFDDYTDPHWLPEPLDAGADFRTTRPMDIVSTLVSIYDTQDLFIKELQHLLAGRLLAVRNSPLDEEIRNVEMLKMRFGEAPLQVCAVMLKDMTDSRRTNTHLHGEEPHPLYTTVISRLFWPTIQPVPLKMPGQFKTLQDSFEADFHKFKPDKNLKWVPQLGAVSLKLDLEDRTVEVEATPIQAGVIELFSEQNADTWNVELLMQKLGGIDRVLVQSALDFWIGEGVVKDEGHTYKLLERAEAMTGAPRPLMVEEAPPVDEKEKHQAEQMKIYWQFIQGMLTNLSSLPIDRIQAMLKFAPGYDRSVQELAVFLESARREGLVIFNNGAWKLAKK
ncbi:ubiquitin-protein ligase [Calocera viscosa TUFC12733]|uniref:Anaphase-promoting complex subunit 2 n=1 Tax=Calocera viscosa (strain TUFC12733) TaxID=1330018 RepID=A0A167S0S6_CALVF|nr:ubiquitin-protein ligase [Calocera viscosa TUFC12733]